MTPIEIPRLEMHAWHRCNLGCESCSHFSPHLVTPGPNKGDCEAWMELWGDLVSPKRFKFVGGEPLLNRDLASLIRFAKKTWPNAEIIVSSNGMSLPRREDVLKALVDVNGTLVLSRHFTEKKYRDIFEFSVFIANKWKDKFDLNFFVVNSVRMWSRRYKEHEQVLSAYHSDQAQAWATCPAKYIQLFDGKLWKCPASAYFNIIPHLRVGDNDWRRIMSDYSPLESTAHPRDMLAFFDRADEAICSCCPGELDEFVPEIGRGSISTASCS